LGLKIESILKKLTNADTKANSQKKLNERLRLLSFANSLGVPFGLMQYVISKEYIVNQEARWFYLTEKYWKAEDYYSKLGIKSGVFGKANEAIPIRLFVTSRSDVQIRDEVCKQKKIEFDSPECIYEIEFNRASIAERANLFGLNQTNVIKFFSEKKMDFDYLISIGAEITANNLLMN